MVSRGVKLRNYSAALVGMEGMVGMVGMVGIVQNNLLLSTGFIGHCTELP